MIPVPRLWPGSTVAILAGGPSLTVDAVRAVGDAGVRIVAVKDAIRMAPLADVLYGCDAKWWAHHGPSLSAFEGLRYSLSAEAGAWGAWILRNAGQTGLELEPSGVRTGKNSGYQAVNLAVHLGAARILLLGFDMRPGPQGQHHWFGPHPYRTADPPYWAFRECFATLAEPLRAAGVAVVNVTPGSALDAFPAMILSEALGLGTAA